MKITKTKLIAFAIILSISFVAFFTYFKFPVKGMVIDSDSDFKRYMCPGKGTKSDPYRIENRKIKVSEFEVAISIFQTSKHFVIQNCDLQGGHSGIRIRYVASGTAKIRNCSIKDSGYYWGAIYVERTDGVVVANNSIIGNQGIGRFRDCSYLTFSNNYMLNNNGGLAIGINFAWGVQSDFVIKDNIFINSPWVGLYIEENIKEVSIKGNKFYNSSIGFASYSIIRDEDYDTYIIEDNYIDDKPIGVFKSQHNITLTSAFGQLFLFECTNLTFINQNFTNAYRPIYATECANIIFIDSFFESTFYADYYTGSQFYNCFSLVLNNVTFIGGRYSFYYWSSQYIDIQNCYFINQTKYCIYLDNVGGGQIIDSYFLFDSSVEMIQGSTALLTLANNTIITY